MKKKNKLTLKKEKNHQQWKSCPSELIKSLKWLMKTPYAIICIINTQITTISCHTKLMSRGMKVSCTYRAIHFQNSSLVMAVYPLVVCEPSLASGIHGLQALLAHSIFRTLVTLLSAAAE